MKKNKILEDNRGLGVIADTLITIIAVLMILVSCIFGVGAIKHKNGKSLIFFKNELGYAKPIGQYIVTRFGNDKS